jgi:hypothetical protein
MRAVLKAQINKTNRKDARGIAQMVGMYRPVHVKTLRSQKLRMLLTHRKLSEGHRHRERSASDFAQLRPQGGRGRNGEVRGPHPGACRDYPCLATQLLRVLSATPNDYRARFSY